MAPLARPGRTLRERVEAYERHLIRAALQQANGSQRRAALALGVRPTTLCMKLKRLGILVRRVVELSDRKDRTLEEGARPP
jgi:transcriptional regulator with GAF, ATPase, and Fis domain